MTDTQTQDLIVAIDRGIEKQKEILKDISAVKRAAVREVLDMYIDFYGDSADEKFMAEVAHKFSDYGVEKQTNQ